MVFFIQLYIAFGVAQLAFEALELRNQVQKPSGKFKEKLQELLDEYYSLMDAIKQLPFPAQLSASVILALLVSVAGSIGITLGVLTWPALVLIRVTRRLKN